MRNVNIRLLKGQADPRAMMFICAFEKKAPSAFVVSIYIHIMYECSSSLCNTRPYQSEEQEEGSFFDLLAGSFFPAYPKIVLAIEKCVCVYLPAF